MSVATEPTITAADPQHDIPDVPIYRLSVAEYHAMAKAGILTADDRVELLEGWLVAKMSKNPAHCLVMGLIQDALANLLTPGWHLRVQGSVTATTSEPEPDLTIVRGQRRDYQHRHPGPGDVAVVIEVADTTLRTDQGSKKRLYARAGIAVYWIVNLVDRCIAVYTEPSGPAETPDYAQHHEYQPGDDIPVILDGTAAGSLTVREVLP
jgi:Uma2 family endonuclease